MGKNSWNLILTDYFKNFKQTGAGTVAVIPVFVSLPLMMSLLKTTIELLFLFATSK